MKLKKPTWFSLLLLLSLTPLLHAQLKWVPVPECGDDLTQLANRLKTEDDPKNLLREAAIGGEASIPILRTRSRPGEPEFTVAGAAQVALARLGDQRSIDELQQEMQGKQDVCVVQAIDKVAEVRSDATLSMLMQYVVRYRQDPHKATGRCEASPLLASLGGMIGMLTDPPYSRAYLTDKAHLDGWEEWWKTAKRPLITPIYPSMPDEQSRCLARLAEWGFPDAVQDLYLRLGKASFPALRSFAKLGGGPFRSVREAAQLTLAKAGDQEQVAKIAKGLEDSPFTDTIKKLRYIANKQAFEALLNSLSLKNFPKYTYIAPDNTEHYVGEELQKEVMAALFDMVSNPPLPPNAPATETNIRIWTSWWETNKDKDVLRVVPFQRGVGAE